jgi:CMP-N-acetylneuraminic acid synthetase
LISYTIKQALAWNKARHIVVTTDSQKIAKISHKCGAQVPFLRPKKLATDSCGKIPVIRHAVIECERLFKERYDIIVDLDVTSPVRTILDLDNCLALFVKNHLKTLFSVVTARKNPYFNMLEKGKDGRICLCKKLEKRILCRQDAPKVYEANASIYFYDRDYLLNSINPGVINDRCMIYVMPDISRIDIDGPLDFKFTEFLLKEGIVKL